jgi:hypothetical protein
VAAERGRRALALLGLGLIALGTTTVATSAIAGPTSADLELARQLFAQAEKDEDAGRWDAALDKLHRVADVRLTSGIRYHEALCEEHLGQLAAALVTFQAARDQARADGANDVLRLVGKHLDDLSPRVPRLTVHVLPAGVNATVTLDGAALPASSLGTPMPIDPGSHRLEASGPPMSPASATVTLQERDITTIELKLGEPPPAPPVAAAPVPAPAPTSAPPPAPPASPTPPAAAAHTSPSHTAAIVATVGAGVLALGGIGAFVLAGNAVGSGQQQCAAQRGPCDGEKNDVRAWDFTAAGAWVGAAAVGALAVVLWFQPSTPDEDAPRASLVVGPGSVAFGGRF